jgi:hypothetical protein
MTSRARSSGDVTQITAVAGRAHVIDVRLRVRYVDSSVRRGLQPTQVAASVATDTPTTADVYRFPGGDDADELATAERPTRCSAGLDARIEDFRD